MSCWFKHHIREERKLQNGQTASEFDFEYGLPTNLVCGSVAQWIARRTSSGYYEGIRRLWVRVPPESRLLLQVSNFSLAGRRKNINWPSNPVPSSIGFQSSLFWPTESMFLLNTIYHFQTFMRKTTATRMGFEPTRAEHNGLAVHRLNHSATSSYKWNTFWCVVINDND